MILVSRIVLSLLGALGAVYAGRSFDLVNRFDSSSYAYATFGIIVFLAFAVGWMVGGLVGKGLTRGFKRVERAAQARSAGETSMLDVAGRNSAQLGIRSQVWDPDTRLVDKGPTTVQILTAANTQTNIASAQPGR